MTFGMPKCARVATMALASLGVCVVSLGGSISFAETNSHGNHFIILIDDSGMAPSQRRAIADNLPRVLFDSGARRPDALPVFRSDNDRLSVGFFAIYRRSEFDRRCRTGRGKLSVSPGDVLHWPGMTPEGTESRAAFRTWLRGQMALPCRGQGWLSPIVTSQYLALASVAARLESDRLFARTIVIVATDLQANLWDQLSDEVANMRKIALENNERLVNEDAARSARAAVSRYFRFEAPPDWQLEFDPPGYQAGTDDAEQRKVWLLIAEVLPLGASPPVISDGTAELERVAVSATSVELRPSGPEQGSFQVFSSDRLAPLGARWHLDSADSEATWVPSAGLGTSTEPGVIDFGNCTPPVCEQRDGRLIVRPLETTGLDLQMAGSDSEPGVADLELRMGFRFLTGELYDHAFVESEPYRVELQPASPRLVPRPLLPAVRLNNSQMTQRWSSRHQDGMTPEEAASEIRAASSRRLSIVGGVLFVLGAGLVVFLFLRYYQRAFAPETRWHPQTVDIDFTLRSSSQLLAGQIEFVNNTPVPWLGRILRNKEQPSRQVSLSLGFDAQKQLVSKGVILRGHPSMFGFGQHDERSGSLSHESTEIVSDQRLVPVFLSTGAIADFRSADPNAPVAPVSLKIKFSADATWRAPRAFSRERGTVELGELSFDLNILPEVESRPIVRFRPAQGRDERIHFKGGEDLRIGSFVFESRSKHAFAQPFSGEYALDIERNGSPVVPSAMCLGSSQISVTGPGTASSLMEIPVDLVCDRENVKNPEPTHDEYEFHLIGPVHAEESETRARFQLFRDPQQADVELQVISGLEGHEIYWDGHGQAKTRFSTRSGGVPDVTRDVEGCHLACPGLAIKVAPDGGLEHVVIGLVIGNSGKSGRGAVTARVNRTLRQSPDLRKQLRLRQGWNLTDVVRLEESGQEVEEVTILEGQPARHLEVIVDPGKIDDLEQPELDNGCLVVTANLEIDIRDDEGHQTRRRLVVEVPVGFRLSPGPRWLAIDIGTSALAAAYGTVDRDELRVLDLQQVPAIGDSSGLADLDVLNTERGTPYLPSCVICNADRREELPDDADYEERPKGFPGYRPASLEIGDPSFVALPAMSSQLGSEVDTRRVVYSLKSWLANASSGVMLDEPIPYRHGNRDLRESRLPMEPLFQSVLSAMAEAYIVHDPSVKPDQLILTHPNTFTPLHRGLYHEFACDALMQRLGIRSDSWVHMISESDAVAFEYLDRQRTISPRDGVERVLVYDFGAGTVDLSIIRVEWSNVGICFPKKWSVECRLGVPIAGNHLDQSLARLVDECVHDAEHRDRVDYRFPVVARRLMQKDRREHRQAIVNLWMAIRRAKERWDGEGHFDVEVGSKLAGDGIVRWGEVDDAETDGLPDRGGSRPAFIEHGGKIVLSIPAAVVRGSTRISQFEQFIVQDVIDEALSMAGLKPRDVNTVLVTGRGALWPGLREAVWNRFPASTERPDLLMNAEEMKSAVVRGAIARQRLAKGSVEETRGSLAPPLAILYDDGNRVFSEEHWNGETPLDLTTSERFRVVQVMTRSPDPVTDLTSLRRYFYVDAFPEPISRDSVAEKGTTVTVVKQVTNGRLSLVFEDISGRRTLVRPEEGGRPVVRPPWPIGRVLLEPEQ